MSNWIPNSFLVPSFIFNEISTLTHCELSVMLFCCSKKGTTSNKFNAESVSKKINFDKVDTFNALKLWCERGLISLDDDYGVDSVFDSFIYQGVISNPSKKDQEKPIGRHGYIYALSNDGFDGFLKIGVTTRDIAKRVAELNKGASSLSLFNVEYFAYTKDVFIVEKKIHQYLDSLRVAENKEFFEINVCDAKKVINKFIRD